MINNTVQITDATHNTNTTMFRDGETLDGLLRYLNYDTSNLYVTVNGEPEDMDYVLEAGDRIVLESKKVKSGR